MPKQYFADYALVGCFAEEDRRWSPHIREAILTWHRVASGRAALIKAARTPERSPSIRLWIVAESLPDMPGLDCIEMLEQICGDSHFIFAATHYSDTIERQALALPRTRFVLRPLTDELIEHCLLRLPARPPPRLRSPPVGDFPDLESSFDRGPSPPFRSLYFNRRRSS